MSALSSTASSSLLSSLTAARPTVTGLASGLDTNKIVEGLLAVQQSRIQAIQDQQGRIGKQQTAFKGIEARLLALQGKISQLARPQNGVFDLRSVTSSDEDLVKGAASANAAPGQYTLHINALAQAHQIASQGFASQDSNVTQGTVTIGGATITIDAGNNTLQGLASAINAANAGVTAAIVNDGSATQPYRLLLTSTKTGTANAIVVTNNLGADGGGAVQPIFDQTTVQAATDASVSLGSGAGALTVLSATNEIDGFLDGLTLDLQGADPATTVTLTVANDVTKAHQAVDDVVTAYNDLMSFIDDQVRVDSATGTAGDLVGNRMASAIQDQVRSSISGSVAGLKSQMNRLGALGITTTNSGQLTINDAKLDDALNGRIAGVTQNDVRNVFALSGASTSPGVQFITASTATKAAATPYQVSVSQAAEQAAVTAATPLAASTVLTSANNAFTITLDGTAFGSISLAPGTYSPQALAQEVQTRINADANLLGRKVTATVTGGNLVISSNSYGAASNVTIGSGTALAALGFAGGETDQGQNVAGSFLVNGVLETATGSGQVLTGNSSNAHTAGLQVSVSLATGQFTPGVVGDLTVSRGLASQLDSVLTGLLDPASGRLKAIEDGFQSSLDDLALQTTKQNEVIETRRTALLSEFASMETTVSQLQGISNFLTNQFGSLSQKK